MSDPVLLSGGNPQISRADGREPVEAYISAMPGWKHEVGRRLDELIVAAVPDVHLFVRYNSPFYAAGPAWEDWFVSFHCLTRYVKVAFPNGARLDPVPPEPSKSGDTRYWHVFEGDDIDAAPFTAWVEQAAAMP